MSRNSRRSSVSRSARRALSRRDCARMERLALRRKLEYFAGHGVGGLAYLSHACFLVLSAGEGALDLAASRSRESVAPGRTDLRAPGRRAAGLCSEAEDGEEGMPPPRAVGGGIPGRELSREGRTVSYPAVPLARARRGVEGVVSATTYLQGTRVPIKPAQSLVTGAPSLRSIDVHIDRLPDHAPVPVFD
jgi:hypothetical protein